MRISIPDDYQNVIATLDAYKMLSGHSVTILHEYYADEESLAKALNDPEILVLTRTRTKVTEHLLSLLPNLKIISQTGKNAGHIDTKACEKKGVKILEGKGDPTSTAELTWALIMNGLRLLPQAINGMKAGRWQINMGNKIGGKTIGIWGYGRIGQKIAQYAKAFDANVLIWGRTASKEKAKNDGFAVAPTKEYFFKNSEVVSLHLRLNDKTKGVVTKQDLLMMKPNALLVNTARAALIEKGALIAALKQGNPGYAALDVFDEEPIFDASHDLLQMPNVICTPHIGYVEKGSFELYFSIAFQNVLDYLASSH